MNISTKAIVLSVIKYNEQDAVVKTYTEQTGFTAYFIRNFFKKNKSRLKKAYFQPANLLELVATHKNKGQLEYIKEARIYYHYKNIHLNFDKLNVATFIREVLLESLKNEQADTDLFRFIEHAFMQLDNEIFNPDFHVLFLLQLSRLLGFFPDNQTQGDYFDLYNGQFTDRIPPYKYLSPADSLILKAYLGMIFDTKNTEKMTSADRKRALDFLMDYYELHIAQFITPKSVKILHRIYE